MDDSELSSTHHSLQAALDLGDVSNWKKGFGPVDVEIQAAELGAIPPHLFALC